MGVQKPCLPWLGAVANSPEPLYRGYYRRNFRPQVLPVCLPYNKLMRCACPITNLCLIMSLLGLRVKLKSDSPYIRSWHMMSHVLTTGVWCGMVSNIVGGIVLSTSAMESTVAGNMVSGSSVAPTPCPIIENTSLRAGTSWGCCMSKCCTKLRGCRVMVSATVWCNRSCVNVAIMPVLILVHELWLRRTRRTLATTAVLLPS